MVLAVSTLLGGFSALCGSVVLATLPAFVLLFLALLDCMVIFLAPVALYKWATGLEFLAPVFDSIKFESIDEEVLLLFLDCALNFDLHDGGVETVGFSLSALYGGHVCGEVDHYHSWFHMLPVGGPNGECKCITLCHGFFPISLYWGAEEVGALSEILCDNEGSLACCWLLYSNFGLWESNHLNFVCVSNFSTYLY